MTLMLGEECHVPTEQIHAVHIGGTESVNAYYRNNPDTITPKLNRIVNELATNETPDYAAMLDELQQYSDDARALNLMGVIEYRRHKRGAAKKAFTEAA